jgi:hypothetical protein
VPSLVPVVASIPGRGPWPRGGRPPHGQRLRMVGLMHTARHVVKRILMDSARTSQHAIYLTKRGLKMRLITWRARSISTYQSKLRDEASICI